MSPPEQSVDPTSQSVHDKTLSSSSHGKVTDTSDPAVGSSLKEAAVHGKQNHSQGPVVLAGHATGNDESGDLIDLRDEPTTAAPVESKITVEAPSAVAKGKQIAEPEASGSDDIDLLTSSMATLKPVSVPASNDTTSNYLTAESSTYIDPTPATPTTSQPPSRTPSSAARSHHSEDLSPSRLDTEVDDRRYTSEDEREGQSRSEIQSIMEQFSEEGGGPGEEEVMSPRLEMTSPIFGHPIQHPPRKSSLEPLATNMSGHLQGFDALQKTTSATASIKSRDMSHDDHGPPVPPKDGTFGTPQRPKSERSVSVASPSSPVQTHRPPPPEPEPEPTLPFDFHRFLEQLRNKKADPVARYLKSFLSEFGKRQWMVHEQVKIIGDFLAFIANKMAQCDVWRDVSDAEFDNAREGMEKLVMNRLYTQTFSPAIMPPKPIPGAKPKRKGADAPMGPGRRGQHQEDVERDDIVTQKINIYGWVKEEHLDIPPVGDSGRRFLKLAQQGM